MKYKEKQDLERMYAEGASATEIAICSDSFVFHRLAGNGGDDGYCCHVSTPFCGWL